jgi:Domain of unknown function (DUF4845)
MQWERRWSGRIRQSERATIPAAAQRHEQGPNKGGFMRKQRGLSLIGTIVTLGILGFVAIMAAKLLPAYAEYYSVKKILATMEQAGTLKGTVRDIRYGFEKLNAIEDVKSVRGEDLEVSKEGGETIVTANWSVRVPMVANVNACLDFYVTTAK